MLFKVNLPVKTPNLIKRLYSGYVWDKYESKSDKKRLYLTFDDGPIPQVTPWVLKTLAHYKAKATFFCIGDNIQKHPEVFNLLLNSDHSIGNHTFNHLNGWKTKTPDYIENALKAENLIEENLACQTLKLFRPPYGKIKNRQARSLKEQGYEIIMYDVIAYDWDKNLSEEKCFKNVIDNSGPGSIIVFHDSLKAEKNMTYALPKILEHYTALGYSFEAL